MTPFAPFFLSKYFFSFLFSIFRFNDFDIDGLGCLGRREFMRVLNLSLADETGDGSNPSPGFSVGGVFSKQDAEDLMVRLDRNHDGNVSWEVRSSARIVLVWRVSTTLI